MTSNPMSNTKVLLYRDDGSTEAYNLRSLKCDILDSGVAVVTFDTPKNRNAITPNQHMECFVILEHLKRSEGCKSVLWTGNGSAFNAGISLRGDRTVYVPDEFVEIYAKRGMAPGGDLVLKPLTLAFWDFPKPIVAAVNGMAVGGAANMALCSNYFDIVCASTEAKFKYPFVSLGFTPELGSSMLMPYTVGMARAKEVMMLGDWFTAKDALDWGMINSVHEPANLFPKALEIATRLAKSPPDAIRLAKRVLNHQWRTQMDRVLDLENDTIMESVQLARQHRKKSKL